MFGCGKRKLFLEEVIRHGAYTILFIALPFCGWERAFFGEPGDDVSYWIACAAAVTFGGTVQILHVPEMWWPGRFDLAFRSHSIMHITTGLATVAQFYALTSDIDSHYYTVSESDAAHYTWLGTRMLAFALAFMSVAVSISNRKHIIASLLECFKWRTQHAHAS